MPCQTCVRPLSRLSKTDRRFQPQVDESGITSFIRSVIVDKSYHSTVIETDLSLCLFNNIRDTNMVCNVRKEMFMENTFFFQIHVYLFHIK